MKRYKTAQKIRTVALAYYYAHREARLAAMECRRRGQGILPRKPAMTTEEKLAAIILCKTCGEQVRTPARLKARCHECLRCYRKKHPTLPQKNSRQRRASRTSGFGKFVAWKEQQVCKQCGAGHTKKAPLDFHHRDPTTKLFKISRGLHRVSAERLWAEVAKCDVLCKDCHEKLHGVTRLRS